MIYKSIISKVLSLVCCLTFSAACAEKVSVVWTEGEANPDTGLATHTLTVLNAPDGLDWSVWMASNYIEPGFVEGTEGTIEMYAGCLYKLTPLRRSGKDLVVKYTDAPLQRHSWAPEGLTLEQNGKVKELDVKYEFLPSERIPDFPYNQVDVEVWDMIPALKSVVPTDGVTLVEDMPQVELVESNKPGWYRIVLDGSCNVQASDADGAWYAKVTLDNLKRNAGGNELPNMVIEDWPDLGYRGFMLDISRNFTNKDNILKFIDLLAHYKVNVFHLHFGDDEGWRIEIENLPELTSYGAYHEFPFKNSKGEYSETNHLMPSYNGKVNPKDLSSTANGHLSKSDYIEILKYAWERRISVIPEFDTPGHSRAAVKSMEKYAERTGDTSYLLSDPYDESAYCSIQFYWDNAINVAMPSTYKFIETVFDALISYHAEAGVPLPAIHVGGDEVARGAWAGSPVCQKLMKEKGWTDIEMLKSYYIENVLDIAEAKGVKLSGWQEVVMDLEPAVYERLKKNLYSVNFWYAGPGEEDVPYKFANDGVPVVVSNVANTYMDLAYTPDKTERGHAWGGFVDERRSFSLLTYDLFRSVRWDDYGNICDISDLSEGKTPIKAKENIVGVQAQLWTETIRNFDYVTYYVFPKVCGVVERAWNASPEWAGTRTSDDPAFSAALDKYYSVVVSHEMPYYESQGIEYRKRR